MVNTDNIDPNLYEMSFTQKKIVWNEIIVTCLFLWRKESILSFSVIYYKPPHFLFFLDLTLYFTFTHPHMQTNMPLGYAWEVDISQNQNQNSKPL